ARQLIRQDEEANLQPAGPGQPILAIDRQRVLAADAEQAFGNYLLIGASAEPGVTDDRNALPDQRLDAEIGAEPGQRWRGGVVDADQSGQDARDGALAAPLRPDDEKCLLMACIAGQAVAENLT